MIAIALGVTLVVIDFTIVNVIVPPIVTDLNIDSISAQWIQESYAIVLAALLLVAGKAADLVGARRMFLTGTALFAAASLAAALAPSGAVLIAARSAQGVGGALIMPASLALLNSMFTGEARAKAFAVWGSVIGGGAALGPLLGGLLGEISWRWAFGVNLVVAAVVVIGIILYVEEAGRSARRIDLWSAALASGGTALVAFGVIEGRHYGWWTSVEPGGPSIGVLSPVPFTLAAAAVALATFVVRQQVLADSGREPLMDLSLFRIKSFSGGNCATVVIGLAEFGILAVLPLWLQFALGYSVFQAGATVAVMAVGAFVASGASFSMLDRFTPLGLVRVGLLLEGLGVLALGLVASPSTSGIVICAALLLYGVGVGFATAQVTNVVLADVPFGKAGVGSGIQGTARQLGSALGIAVLTTLFFTSLNSRTTDRLAERGIADPGGSISSAVSDSAGGAIARLDASAVPGAADAAREAMSHAVALTGYACAALLLLGTLTTLLIPRRRLAPAQEPAMKRGPQTL